MALKTFHHRLPEPTEVQSVLRSENHYTLARAELRDHFSLSSLLISLAVAQKLFPWSLQMMVVDPHLRIKCRNVAINAAVVNLLTVSGCMYRKAYENGGVRFHHYWLAR